MEKAIPGATHWAIDLIPARKFLRTIIHVCSNEQGRKLGFLRRNNRLDYTRVVSEVGPTVSGRWCGSILALFHPQKQGSSSAQAVQHARTIKLRSPAHPRLSPAAAVRPSQWAYGCGSSAFWQVFGRHRKRPVVRWGALGSKAKSIHARVHKKK